MFVTIKFINPDNWEESYSMWFMKFFLIKRTSSFLYAFKSLPRRSWKIYIFLKNRNDQIQTVQPAKLCHFKKHIKWWNKNEGTNILALRLQRVLLFGIRSTTINGIYWYWMSSENFSWIYLVTAQRVKWCFYYLYYNPY